MLRGYHAISTTVIAMSVLSMHARTAIATERMTQFDMMDSDVSESLTDGQAVYAIPGLLCWGAPAKQQSGTGIRRLKDIECKNSAPCKGVVRMISVRAYIRHSTLFLLGP